MTNGRRALVAAVATGVLGVGGLATMSTVASAGGPPVPASCQVTTYAYELTHLDGSVEYTTRIRGTGDASPVQPGDQITVMFDVPSTCPEGVELSIASYRTAEVGFAPAEEQILWESATGVFQPGPHTMTVHAFGAPAGDPADCAVSHHSDTGHGANTSGPYDSTCNGSASLQRQRQRRTPTVGPAPGASATPTTRTLRVRCPTATTRTPATSATATTASDARTRPTRVARTPRSTSSTARSSRPSARTIMYGDRKIDWTNI